MKIGQPEDARYYFEKGVRMHPHRAVNWLWMGRLWMEPQYEPDMAKAEYCLLRCLQLAPEKSDCLNALDQIYQLQVIFATITTTATACRCRYN